MVPLSHIVSLKFPRVYFYSEAVTDHSQSMETMQANDEGQKHVLTQKSDLRWDEHACRFAHIASKITSLFSCGQTLFFCFVSSHVIIRRRQRPIRRVLCGKVDGR